jgi:hypothetical protein
MNIPQYHGSASNIDVPDILPPPPGIVDADSASQDNAALWQDYN